MNEIKHTRKSIIIFIFLILVSIVGLFLVYNKNLKGEKSISNDSSVSVYVDNVSVDEIDNNYDYELDRYTCTNGGQITWDKTTKTISVSPITKIVNCQIYLTKVSPWYEDCSNSNTIACKIINDNSGGVSDANIDFNYNSEGCNVVTNCTPVADQITNNLYYTADSETYGEDKSRIYYFRGDIENNWVSFGRYKWRVMRTTGEGGIKLLYSGDGTSDGSAFINNAGTTTYSLSESHDSKYYVGYTYNLSKFISAKIEQKNSVVKNVVDEWYLSSGLPFYVNYISDTAVYCNDRGTISDSSVYAHYPSWFRLFSDDNLHPTYECLSYNASRYTKSSKTGNGYLDYPIAIATIDEFAYAGLIFVQNASAALSSYVFDNMNASSIRMWLMTPGYYTTSDSMYPFVWTAYNGNIYVNRTTHTHGVRPVIALKSCVTYSSGTGSFDSPYVISDAAC